MQYRNIQGTDLKVSEISLGCWTLGGPNWNFRGISCGWPAVEEKEAIQAIRWAIEKGVNHFDTADVYGDGHAERLLAKGLGSKRNDVIIATKIGYYKGTAEHPYEGLHVRHQCEQSLKNLKRDYIDIYYFHNCQFGVQNQYLPEALEMMHRLRDEGKVRVIGLSDWSEEALCKMIPHIDPQVIQCWGSALDDHYIREGSALHTMMTARKISYVAFSPLAQGLLLDKYHPSNPPKFESGDNRLNSKRFSKDYLEKLEPRMKKIKERFGSSPEALSRMALQYLLYNPLVACVIPGFRNERQVKCNLAAEDKPLTAQDVEFIQNTLQV
ncbi:MAG: aldo/keto reductase [Deltaproteobacteria bacterium]|nr:aldo/keto reductase [Deltaproteobacteria bacterium]